MKKFVCILIFSFLLVSCSQKPEFVRVDNVVVAGLKDSLLMVHMNYVVYNPNDVKSKLKQSGMDIFYKESLVGQGILDKQLSLAANDTVKVPVRCEISLKKLHLYYPELLASEASIFNIKGDGKVSFLLNSFTIDMDDEIQLNTKAIIHGEIRKNISKTNNFKIRSVAASKLPTFSKTELNLQVLAKNNLPLEYTIENIKLQFYMDKGNDAVAEWTLAEPLVQKALETVNIPINASLNNLGILKNAKLSWLTQKKVNFNILGNADIKINGYQFNVPIKDTLSLTM
ncbi:hypothetical protein [Costertonia aggregata]|uniref:LEA type 2 family protein n=1 Tax=Costertonia aggregata TaxID=343403 RepID=A0A7H9ANW3_9FLAO|nr:hypothetical protein [Costertonia aggregata]QLG45073.1 hypothetical protein HYG79_06820 [Costertonia aggregata]